MVYRIDSCQPYSTSPWNTPTYVNSLVFNNADSVLFAGTANGVKYHSTEYDIDRNWNDYIPLSLTGENVQQLHVIPTDPSFKGILYAMTSDSASRVSKIWRNIIDENMLIGIN